jgi:hypothetical protein
MIWRGGESRGGRTQHLVRNVFEIGAHARVMVYSQLLCLGWLQQIRHAAETSREANHAKLQSRTDPNYARRFG